jgi:O-antigen ligase
LSESGGLIASASGEFMVEKRGGFVAPFFFLALALAGVGSRYGAVTPWALAALALAATAWAGHNGTTTWTRLSAAVLCYALVVGFNTLLLSPSYIPAGLFHPLLLAAAFLAVRALAPTSEKATMAAALAMGGGIAVWGLVQIGPMGIARAHAFFETPATFAAVINLPMVPVLVAVLLGSRRISLLVIAVILAAALFAADSRGATLALAAGLGFATILALRARLLKPRRIGVVLILIAAGWLVVTALRALPATHHALALDAKARAESSVSRLELYALSWNAWLKQPIGGSGYLTFRHTLEQGRAQVPSYGSANVTWFVHNDYLQTLQELGLFGFLALLSLTLLPLLIAYQRLPGMAENKRQIVVACASGLGAMSVHALVDFPFYVPVCLVLYGALLGALDARLGATPAARVAYLRASRWVRAMRTGALAIAAIVLLRPVAAEAAAEWGLRKFAAGEGQKAAFWLGAAQRLDSRDWRYHWYAGQFWDAQAADAGRPEAARLAAEAFATGFEANPLEARNLLGKISVHRRYSTLLEKPADPGVLRQWRAQAQALAPLDPLVQRELAR